MEMIDDAAADNTGTPRPLDFTLSSRISFLKGIHERTHDLFFQCMVVLGIKDIKTWLSGEKTFLQYGMLAKQIVSIFPQRPWECRSVLPEIGILGHCAVTIAVWGEHHFGHCQENKLFVATTGSF